MTPRAWLWFHNLLEHIWEQCSYASVKWEAGPWFISTFIEKHLPATEMALKFSCKTHTVLSANDPVQTWLALPCQLAQAMSHGCCLVQAMGYWDFWNTLWAPESSWAMNHGLLPSCHSSALKATERAAQRTRQSQLDFFERPIFYTFLKAQLIILINASGGTLDIKKNEN